MTSSSRGFTLIEVMVALTLLAVVAGLLASGTRLSLDVSSRGEARGTPRTPVPGPRGHLRPPVPVRWRLHSDAPRLPRVRSKGVRDPSSHPARLEGSRSAAATNAQRPSALDNSLCAAFAEILAVTGQALDVTAQNQRLKVPLSVSRSSTSIQVRARPTAS